MENLTAFYGRATGPASVLSHILGEALLPFGTQGRIVHAVPVVVGFYRVRVLFDVRLLLDIGLRDLDWAPHEVEAVVEVSAGGVRVG